MENILQVLNYAANYRGNFMDSLKELDQQLHEKGKYCVYFFMVLESIGMKIDWISEMVSENIPVYFIPDSKFAWLSSLREIIKKHQIGIIHTHFLTAKQFAVIKACNMGLNVDIVLHFHNHAVLSNKLTKRLVRKRIYAGCKMIGVSASVAAGLRKIYPYNKCYEVENAIDFKRLENTGEFDLMSENNELNAKICLIFGFDYERKGVDLALDAISQIVEDGERILLVISLSTNEEIIKKRIESRFGKIPTWVVCVKARNDVATLYRNADVFLSPSREEGFCYSIVEAAYCGCHVVASKIPAQQDLKVPGVYWFETEDVEALRESIYKAICDDIQQDLQNQLKAAYDLSNWAEKVIEVYESV